MHLILIADDDPDNLDLLSEILEPSFKTVTAANGQEAVELARKMRPDIIILDVNMPVMNGIEAAQELRADTRTKSIPIIIATASDDRETRFQLKQIGCEEYLLKPIDPREVITRVKQFLQQKEDRLSALERTQRLEQERASLHEQLIRADRLSTLGNLAAGVGHELKNVAVVMNSAISEMRRSAVDGTPLDPELVGDLAVAFEHLQLHAMNLLNLGRPGPDLVAPHDLREIVNQTVTLMRQYDKTQFLAVTTDIPSHETLVKVNRTRVEQVLLNLIGNAADALRDARTPDPAVTVRIREGANGRFVCSITDNGPGIPEKILGRIFDPYFTTKGPTKGTGLGLVVARQIVESYGGQLNVDTTLGSGTTFTLDLPNAAVIEDATAAFGRVQ